MDSGAKTALKQTTVICIDTGKRCGYGCTHPVSLIMRDGNWESIGEKSRGEIIQLHRKYDLEIHEHFLDDRSVSGQL